MRWGPGSAMARSSCVGEAPRRSSARAASTPMPAASDDEVEVGPGEVEHVERLRARRLGADPAAAPC